MCPSETCLVLVLLLIGCSRRWHEIFEPITKHSNAKLMQITFDTPLKRTLYLKTENLLKKHVGSGIECRHYSLDTCYNNNNNNNNNNIHEKLLNSYWQSAMQFKCNIAQKSVTIVQKVVTPVQKV